MKQRKIMHLCRKLRWNSARLSYNWVEADTLCNSKALSTLAIIVAEFGDSRRFRRQSPNTATVTNGVAVLGDWLPNSATNCRPFQHGVYNGTKLSTEPPCITCSCWCHLKSLLQLTYQIFSPYLRHTLYVQYVYTCKMRWLQFYHELYT